eukprot:scaffold4409_cov369-Prasinococcus_capsulatus_cf.AAC.24
MLRPLRARLLRAQLLDGGPKLRHPAAPLARGARTAHRALSNARTHAAQAAAATQRHNSAPSLRRSSRQYRGGEGGRRKAKAAAAARRAWAHQLRLLLVRTHAGRGAAPPRASNAPLRCVRPPLCANNCRPAPPKSSLPSPRIKAGTVDRCRRAGGFSPR